MDLDDRRRRLDQLESASHRYVAFWGIVCLVAFFLLGWPALIAWVGLAWGMDQLCRAMRGNAPGQHPQTTRHTQKPKGRCRD